MQQMLKCYYCGQTFDRTKEEYVQVKSRRYAHKRCYDNRSEEEVDRDEFWETLDEVFHGSANYNYQKVDSQLRTYLKQGYTLRGIINAVKYWFIVKNGSIVDAKKGIGIVPFIYKDAQEYEAYLSKQRAEITSIDEMQSTKVQKIQKREKKVEILDFD